MTASYQAVDTQQLGGSAAVRQGHAGAELEPRHPHGGHHRHLHLSAGAGGGVVRPLLQ